MTIFFMIDHILEEGHVKYICPQIFFFSIRAKEWARENYPDTIVPIKVYNYYTNELLSVYHSYNGEKREERCITMSYYTH